VGSELGITNEKLEALADYATSPLYTETERLVLEYADAMTITGRDVSEELFGRLREIYDDDALVELTMLIAWENSSSKFNRALRVPSQKLWKR
jgi:alkylhydroperoxidase family enzyme